MGMLHQMRYMRHAYTSTIQEVGVKKAFDRTRKTHANDKLSSVMVDYFCGVELGITVKPKDIRMLKKEWEHLPKRPIYSEYLYNEGVKAA